MNAQSLGRAVDGLVAGDFSDPTNERLIYLSAAGLAIIGIGLLVGTILWWRRGRQEHPALAPLEVMSARAWANAPDGERRRRLEQVRLSGAGAAVDEPVAVEPVDLEALVRSVPQAFDDLREPSAVIALPAVPAGEEAVEKEADAAVAADPEFEEARADEPAADPDATSLSTVRPAEVVEASASGPHEPSL
jgi:hypothetical protein